MKKLFYLSVCVFIIGLSCTKVPLSFEEQKIADNDKILQYLADNNLTAESTASGLHYIIEEPGSGPKPTINSTVEVTYNGYLLNGDVFDARTTSFPLANVIAGWQEGIPLFRKGGKGVLFIPSYLGYGSQAQGPIPGSSVLIFDIELLDF